MRKFSFIMALLCIILVFGFLFSSCGDDEGNTIGGGSNSTEPGTLTITNIPLQFNGMYARFYSSIRLNYNNSLEIIEGAQSVEGFGRDIIKCKITNSRVTLPIWRYALYYDSETITDPKRWDNTYFILQNGVRKELIIGEHELYNHRSDTHENFLISFDSVTIEFTNGSATVSANLGTLSEQ